MTIRPMKKTTMIRPRGNYERATGQAAGVGDNRHNNNAKRALFYAQLLRVSAGLSLSTTGAHGSPAPSTVIDLNDTTSDIESAL